MSTPAERRLDVVHSPPTYRPNVHLRSRPFRPSTGVNLPFDSRQHNTRKQNATNNFSNGGVRIGVTTYTHCSAVLTSPRSEPSPASKASCQYLNGKTTAGGTASIDSDSNHSRRPCYQPATPTHAPRRRRSAPTSLGACAGSLTSPAAALSSSIGAQIRRQLRLSEPRTMQLRVQVQPPSCSRRRDRTIASHRSHAVLPAVLRRLCPTPQSTPQVNRSGRRIPTFRPDARHGIDKSPR